MQPRLSGSSCSAGAQTFPGPGGSTARCPAVDRAVAGGTSMPAVPQGQEAAWVEVPTDAQALLPPPWPPTPHHTGERESCYRARFVFACHPAAKPNTQRRRLQQRESLLTSNHVRKREREPQIRFLENGDSGTFMGWRARWSEMWREVIGGEERGGNCRSVQAQSDSTPLHRCGISGT